MRLIPSPGGGTEIQLAGEPPLALTLTSSTGTELTGFLRIRNPVVQNGPPRTDTLQAGVPLTVRITASVDEVILRIPGGGATEVCGIQ